MVDEEHEIEFFLNKRLDYLAGCCNEHLIGKDHPEVYRVLRYQQWCEHWPSPKCYSYCTRGAAAIFITFPEDGVYVFTEWQDTSGHGCQCRSNVKRFDTLGEAITLGLDADERVKLCLTT
jgi:hypothetical protein